MKKLLVIAFVLIVISMGNAQDYIPMLGNSNQWYVLQVSEGGGTGIFMTKGDTLINNKIYKILGVQNFADIAGFIREEIIDRKVYMMPNSIKDTFEIVYFDFSLNENDSILLYSINYDSLGYFKVDSFREISTSAGFRRAIYLSNTRWDYWSYKPVWVEGIGTLGSIDCREGSPLLVLGELSCFFKDGVKIYQSEFSKELDTCIIEWSGIEDFELQSDIMFYPNPAGSETTIKVKNDYPFSVYIFDIYGQLLLEVKNQTKIDLNNLSNGTYLIKVIVQEDIYTEILIIIR